ncbi:transporter substrate-binding domain-containing protein [Gordonia aichiensis]
MTHRARILSLLAATAVVCSVALSGCGSSDDTVGSAEASAVPTQDITSRIAKDERISAELPANVRSAGTLTVGTTQTPGTSNLPHGGVVDNKNVGLDLDLRSAIGKVLGLNWDVQYGTFASIIPGVQNGKYQVGQANFGVTAEREKVLDFSTYLNDGQGFLGSSRVDLQKVSTITDVCGYTIATTPGSTFQTLLSSHVADCAKVGKKPWTVQYFNDTAPIFLGLANGKVDLFFGPVLSLKYDEKHVEGTKFLGQISSTPVGFVTAKDSGLAKPLSDAVNKLIETGDYAKIFAKWGVPDTGVDRSTVNPPSTF